MANKQIYQLNSLSGISGSYLIPVQDQSGSLPLSRISASALQSTILQQNVTNVTLQGTTTGSTARLAPGINVATNTNSQNFCARLPLNTQPGDTVSLINNGAYNARIFPPLNGGSINLSTYVDVPANGLTYTFINSNGSWSTLNTARNINTLTYDVMTFSHITGSSLSGMGIGTFSSSIDGVSPISGSTLYLGAGLAGGNPYYIYLSPSESVWRSEPFPATATRFKMYTNILESDFNPGLQSGGNYLQNTLIFNGWYAFKSGSNYTATGAIIQGYVGIDNLNDPLNGTYTVPLTNGGDGTNIGDGGTIYADIPIQASAGWFLGTNPAPGIDASYYTFAVTMGQYLKTKDYKFRFELDYI